MRHKTFRIVCLLGAVVALTTACTTVKPWERDTLASESMAIDDKPCQRFERSSEAYREGAVGANGGTSGAGCGCS